MTVNRSKPDQYQLRFPPGLRDRLKAAADLRSRSLNAEIVARLEGSFKGWPKITLPDELFERVKNAGFEKRKAMESEIETFTVKVIERELPASYELEHEARNAFERMLGTLPTEERARFREQFSALSNDVWKLSRQKQPE